MTEREILVAIVQKQALPDLDNRTSSQFLPDASAFPHWWREVGSVNTIRSYDGPLFDGFVRKVRLSVERLMDKLTRPSGTAYKRLRLGDLSDDVPAPSRVAKLSKTSASQSESLDQVRGALATLAPGAQRDLLMNAVDGLRLFGKRAAARGVRRTWAELMGVAGDPSSDLRFLDDIAWEWVFRHTGAIMLIDVMGLDAADAITFARRIPIESCPGSWLSRQVELEIRKRESQPDASSAYDLDHLVYFPYVDFYYADKRIVDHTRIVLARGGTPAELAGRSAPTFVGRSVAKLATSLTTR
jgi:hypothetical protein